MKRSLFWLVAVVLAVAVPGFAQTNDERVRVSFGAGLMSGGDDGDPSLLASAGYRFSTHWSFDVEVTAAEGSDRFRDPRILRSAREIGIVPSGFITGSVISSQTGSAISQVLLQGRPNVGQLIAPGFEDEGETMIATAGFRYELPTQTARFRPFVGGGIGVSRTETETRIPFVLNTITSAPTRVGVTQTAIDDDDDEDGFSHTGMALSAGVGASIRVFKGLAIDLDARYFRLDRGRNLGSFGGGVSYRF